jgi:hypothetical protein
MDQYSSLWFDVNQILGIDHSQLIIVTYWGTAMDESCTAYITA